jgi:hypothetical protein
MLPDIFCSNALQDWRELIEQIADFHSKQGANSPVPVAMSSTEISLHTETQLSEGFLTSIFRANLTSLEWMLHTKTLKWFISGTVLGHIHIWMNGHQLLSLMFVSYCLIQCQRSPNL